MIAIVILGLGMVMVATIFPVAWTRARALSETATEQSVVAGAKSVLPSLIRPTGLRESFYFDPNENNHVVADRLVSGGLLGDLFYDPKYCGPTMPGLCPPMAYSDTRVHALHMTNFAPGATAGEEVVAEDPWELERVDEWFGLGSDQQDLLESLIGSGSPFDPQVQLWQRVHPPLPSPPTDRNSPGYAQWEQQLLSRRAAWAALHRLREPVGPAPLPATPTLAEVAEVCAEATAAIGSARVFDMYYVTLRRPNPGNRYARQDSTAANSVPPLPGLVLNPPAAPQARPAGEDVAFPIAWRVEVEFLNNQPGVQPFAYRSPPPGAFGATGVPTEVRIPRSGTSTANGNMLVGMFPEGTRFVDEISGQIYRAVKRRINVTGSDEQTAILTLDREVFVEDLDYMDTGNMNTENPFVPSGKVDPKEFMRTVWVFPPPVDRENSSSPTTPTFSGTTPVINIDVRPMSLAPSS